jgi:hypothetical protein
MRQGLRIVVVVAAISVMGTAALAWTPTDQAIATAQQGKVWYSVIPDPQGGPALGRAVVDINAPPAVVWKLLMDCAAAERLMPSNRGCRVLKRDPAGRWDIREHIIKTPLMPNMRTVFREDLTPEKSMVITRVEGDLKVIGGEWRLEPLAGGARTRVSQEMRIEPAFPAPGPMVRQFLRGEVSGGLANLKREAEAAR